MPFVASGQDWSELEVEVVFASSREHLLSREDAKGAKENASAVNMDWGQLGNPPVIFLHYS
jgi:hypothetical protein